MRADLSRRSDDEVAVPDDHVIGPLEPSCHDGVREVFGPGPPTTAIVDYVRGLPVEPA